MNIPRKRRAQMRTIRILGAGPAGLIAGIQLARHGFPVEIREKQADVGVRHHNDFQGLENWSQEADILEALRGLGLEADFFTRPFNKGVVYLPSLRTIEVQSRQTIFYLIKRGQDADTLDSALKRQALDAGVRIRFGNSQGHDADIIATGPPRANIVAAGINFETSLHDQARAILSDVLAPKGYAYFLVADGRATLATVLFRDFRKASSCLEETFKTFRKVVKFDVRNPRRFGGYGYFACPRSGFKEGKLYVGEAVGFQDFLFGFGLRYALMSGYCAAQSIISGADYDVLWRKAFRRYMINSHVNRFFYERFTQTAYHLLRLFLDHTDNPRAYLRWIYGLPLQRFVSPVLSRGTR